MRDAFLITTKMAKTRKQPETRKSVEINPSSVTLPNILIYKQTEEFMTIMRSKSSEERQATLDNMRNLREFYKGIIKEDYRVHHPGTFRYVEAEKILSRLHENGIALKNYIDSNK